MNGESFDFYLSFDNGNAVTNNDPSFSVAFGKRSVVEYIDPLNKVRLGAAFNPPITTVDTEDLSRQVQQTPTSDPAAYTRLILERIRAAAAWRDDRIIFRGPWGDAAAGQAPTL